MQPSLDTPLVIANPHSARVGAAIDAIRRRLTEAVGPVPFAFTEAPGHAGILAREAARRGCSHVIAVGGDGTVNEVVNGLMQDDKPVNPATALSFIMRGTGNDFRRTLTGSRDLEGDIAALASGRECLVDIGRLTFHDHHGRDTTRYFNNLASFGLSGEVDRRVNDSTFAKRFGGSVAFLWGTLRALGAFRNKSVRLRIDDCDIGELSARLVVVANGRYAGGGMCFAPDALPDDGLFDVVTIESSLWRTVRYFPHLYRGTHVDLPGVRTFRGRSIVATSDEAVLLDVDGEAPGRLPASFTILPRVLRLRC